ncbi:MAG: NYN domain-containing protein [Candidatus Beckwithbacteria bacterium]|nr:NYN domain-containing protein [Patescibacteria group bacterium]
MGSYYYLDDPESESGSSPVFEDDYLSAIFSIAKKLKLKITDKMILDEVFKKKPGKTNKKMTNLYIDGTNLFAGQNVLFGPHQYLSFTYLMKEIKKIIRVDKVFFYASYMNSKQRKKLTTTEALFYREVKETKNVFFYKGHRSPTTGKEKGVDVHMAVDIVKDALLGNCGQVVVMTGDADLIYPIEVVKFFGISTKALFLPNRFSAGIAHGVSRAYVLNFLTKFKKGKKDPPQMRIISIKNPRIIKIRGR